VFSQYNIQPPNAAAAIVTAFCQGVSDPSRLRLNNQPADYNSTSQRAQLRPRQ
jgi:hypothetical protein